MNELRKQLREAGVEFQVIKNTMTRRAAAAAGIEGLDPMLVGPTAIAFSKEDVVAPAKILSKFAKEHEQLEIKGGLVEGKVVGLDEIQALADLPSREGLLSMLLSVLQAPSATLRWPSKRWRKNKSLRKRNVSSKGETPVFSIHVSYPVET